MFRIPAPELQIEFSLALAEIRRRYLQEALQETVGTLPIAEVDSELATVAQADALQKLARHSIRGELLFPVPLILAANPYLLGYYRLLYGFSQKQFYTAATGVGAFKSMEERGVVSKARLSDIAELCRSMAPAGAALLDGLGAKRVSVALLDDLTLLTIGPQLRGGANVKKGARGIVKVFEAIHEIVKQSAISVDDARIVARNAAQRLVYVEFAPDPDIIIREEIAPSQFAEKIAIEVKAGEDFSNIHNRLGEAEKSHQKARQRGYVECWTIVNVDRIDMEMARRESPTTNRFYRISDIMSGTGAEFLDFRNRILSLIGV